jgi:Ca2+-binding EF-hand superfamily protein
MTTNNVLTTVRLFFVGDANEVNAVAFKDGLKASAIENGIHERYIFGEPRLQAGSILADMTVTGVAWGRVLDELIAAGKISVLVDGVKYVAYGTYGEIDPYRNTPHCIGDVLANVTYFLPPAPLGLQLEGYEPRNESQLLPSELFAFDQLALANAEAALATKPELANLKVCIRSYITYIQDDESFIDMDIYLANWTVNFPNILNETKEMAARALGNEYKRGNFVSEINGEEVEATGMDSSVIDRSYFQQDKAADATLALVLGAIGVLIICILLLGLIYRAKGITDTEHRKRVSMAIAPSAVWGDKEGVMSGQGPLDFTSEQLENFAYKFETPGARLAPNNKRQSLKEQQSKTSLGLYLDMGGQSPTSQPTSYQSPAGGSVGYFAVGDINPPDVQPGPGMAGPSNHFYPSGSSLFGAATMAPKPGSKGTVAEYGLGPGLVKTSRPSLTDDGFRNRTSVKGPFNEVTGGGPRAGDDEFSSAVTALSSFAPLPKGDYVRSYTDPSHDDGWGGGGGWADTGLPGGDHDFPTLKPANAFVRPPIEPGYARPAELGVVETMDIHYAAARDSTGFGAPTADLMGSQQKFVNSVQTRRPTLVDHQFDSSDSDSDDEHPHKSSKARMMAPDREGDHMDVMEFDGGIHMHRSSIIRELPAAARAAAAAVTAAAAPLASVAIARPMPAAVVETQERGQMMAELGRWFATLDHDGNGLLSPAEIRNSFDLPEVHDQLIKYLHIVCPELDADNDGSISADELIFFADTNGDGKITPMEFYRAMGLYGASKKKLIRVNTTGSSSAPKAVVVRASSGGGTNNSHTTREAALTQGMSAEMFNEIDADGDGKLTIDEFVAWQIRNQGGGGGKADPAQAAARPATVTARPPLHADSDSESSMGFSSDSTMDFSSDDDDEGKAAPYVGGAPSPAHYVPQTTSTMPPIFSGRPLTTITESGESFKKAGRARP